MLKDKSEPKEGLVEKVVKESDLDDLLATAWNSETRKGMAEELRVMGLDQEAIKRILRMEDKES